MKTSILSARFVSSLAVALASSSLLACSGEAMDGDDALVEGTDLEATDVDEADALDGDEPVGETQDGLSWDTTVTRPSSADGFRVDVCFINGASDVRNTVRLAIDRTWTSVSRLDFRGWGNCPSPIPARTVPIEFREVAAGSEGVSASRGLTTRRTGADEQILFSLSPTRKDLAHFAVYGIGKAIGLGDENRRDDVISCSADAALDSRLGGRTPFDPDSVMNRCGAKRTDLSFWDAVGARRMFQARTWELLPVMTQFSDKWDDHATHSWLHEADINNEISGLLDPDYFEAYKQGWAFASQAPGTVRAELWKHTGHDDFVLVAHHQTRADAIAGGYVRSSLPPIFIYASQQTGTVALKLFWSEQRKDNFHALSGSPGALAALAEGYVEVRTEGFIFGTLTPPYNLLVNYYKQNTDDHLLTIAGSPLAASALANGYATVGIDGVSLKAGVVGTARLRQLFSSQRQDNFTTTQTALPGGYTEIASEGFVYTNPIINPAGFTSTKPLQLWWHQVREDNFTTVDRGPSAAAANYVQGPNQGHSLLF